MLRTAIERLKAAHERRFDPLHPVAAEFISMARDAAKAADGWGKHQTTVELTKVISILQLLRNLKGLDGLLDAMNNRENSRKSLINVIRKVSRYGEVAHHLFRASRRHAVLQSMRPTVIGLPFEAYARPQLEKNVSKLSLQAALGNIYETVQAAQIGRICHILKITEHQCNEQLSSQAIRTLREEKIHAEIQRLYHLELNSFNARCVAGQPSNVSRARATSISVGGNAALDRAKITTVTRQKFPPHYLVGLEFEVGVVLGVGGYYCLMGDEYW